MQPCTWAGAGGVDEDDAARGTMLEQIVEDDGGVVRVHDEARAPGRCTGDAWRARRRAGPAPTAAGLPSRPSTLGPTVIASFLARHPSRQHQRARLPSRAITPAGWVRLIAFVAKRSLGPCVPCRARRS